MLTLNDLIAKKKELESILQGSNISLANCKVFGDVLGKQFPISADLHLLITLGEKTDREHWDNLQRTIKNLFDISVYIKFYNATTLDRLVEIGELAAEHVAKMREQAIPLTELEALAKQKKIVDVVQDFNPLSTTTVFFKTEVNDTVESKSELMSNIEAVICKYC